MNDKITQIRLADIADATLIHEYVRKLAAYEGLTEYVVSSEIEMTRMLRGDFGVRAILAFQQEQPIGFATFYMTFSTFTGRSGLYIEDLYIDEASRKTGAGQAMMQWLAAWALKHACDRMSWLALDWNHSAHHFYEKLGAQVNTSWLPFVLKGQALEKLGKYHDEASLK